MKVLVTGCLGYIGCELLYKLADTDIEVIGIDNSCEAILSRLGFFSRYKNIKFIKYDICDDLDQFKDVDLIIHLASVVGYITCGEQPEEAQRTNIDGTKNIVKLNKPTVFLSTGSVYGDIGQDCDENVTPRPQTLYSKTKLEGEEIVKTLPEYVIYRPATAYGLSFKVRHDLLIHNLCQDAVTNNYIELYQPNASRSFYSVQKLAELCKFSITNFSNLSNDTYNVGSEKGSITKRELVNMIQQHIDIKVDIVEGEDLDKRDYKVNYNKLKNKWSEIDETFNVEQIINYYKNV